MGKVVLAASAVLGLVSTVARATTYQADPSNFASVFNNAQGGDTIVATGVFGATNLTNRSFVVPLTIDATNAAFTNSLLINNVQGLHITGGTFGSTTGTVRYNAAVAAFNDSNLTFTKAYVIGAQTGTGIALISSTGVSVTNSVFDSLHSGIDVANTTGAVLDHNRSTRAASDGFDIAGSHNVTVTNSSCTGSNPTSGAHPDCIQLYSIQGLPVQSDITVTNNFAHGATQGFTAFTGYAGGGLRYNISYNTAELSFSQGVACDRCIDSVLSYNTLVTLPGSKHITNFNVANGADNIIYGNTRDGQPVPNQSPLPQPFDLGMLDTADPTYLLDLALSDELRDELAWDDTTFAGLITSAEAGSAAPVVAGVPEPTTWALVVAGFGAVGAVSRRRRRSAPHFA